MDAGPPHDRQEQLRNIPEQWARRDPTVQHNFLNMLQSHTTVPLHTACVSEAYITKPKEGGKVFCYASISVNNEDDGNTFLKDVNQVEVDGVNIDARLEHQVHPQKAKHTTSGV